MRDFQDCFQFDWKTRKAGQISPAQTPSLSVRKRRRKVCQQLLGRGDLYQVSLTGSLPD